MSTTIPARQVTGTPRAFDTVVLGGGVAGILDIMDPLIIAGVNGGAPVRVLHAIASGVLGRSA